MFQGFTGWHALVILIIVLLLFGAPKLPALARSLGQSMKIFRKEVRTDPEAPAGGETAESAAGPQAAVPAAGGQPAPVAQPVAEPQTGRTTAAS